MNKDQPQATRTRSESGRARGEFVDYKEGDEDLDHTSTSFFQQSHANDHHDDLDGVPMTDDDIDGRPIDSDDIDGIPISSSTKPKLNAPKSKWEDDDIDGVPIGAGNSRITFADDDDIDGVPLPKAEGKSKWDDDNDVVMSTTTTTTLTSRKPRDDVEKTKSEQPVITDEQRELLRQLEVLLEELNEWKC